jgi:hypothetical protein
LDEGRIRLALLIAITLGLSGSIYLGIYSPASVALATFAIAAWVRLIA